MTIVRVVTQVKCDSCLKAFIYPEGDITQYLTANDWVVDGQTHTCPWCARKTELVTNANS